MEARTILEIRPALTEYLRQFDDCFARSQTREHLRTYVQGQLSDLPRKSVEPMADAAGVPPRTLQEFLGLSKWDESMMRDRLQRRVAARHSHPQALGIIDETTYVKKGDKTACVQRQHCGAAGKTENCVASVHLGYATPDFHTLLDGDLYLPEHTWHEDRARCREAGIPEGVVYRPKWRIALEQYQRALGNGLRLAWLTFDEGYGGKPPFLRELDRFGQNYVGEVPRDFCVWTSAPPVLQRAHARDRAMGRPRKYPRLKVKHNPLVKVENVARYSRGMVRQTWMRYRVKDGSRGPMVWEVKHLLVYLRDEEGLPTRAHHLLAARSVTDPSQVKYFLSNAPEDTPVGLLLLVAFSRWKIERIFEDSKMELGMDHFEVRRFGSVSRHLILTCVSHLFLAEFHQKHAGVCRGEKYGLDDQPIGHGGGAAGCDLGTRWPLLVAAGRSDRGAIDFNPAAQRQGRPQPPQGNDSKTARLGRETEPGAPMLLASVVAL